ncbi:hypothetical protein NitYY0826_P33 (plasmid) [Nitratiruptor sp. YY08-26]|uniref:hypothetical protein n=1 Tax=unclassified Nitratiruptor TaxID=2624044 RepID=UPI0018EDBC40|nr:MULTISPECIES: hypothetical protein [unclassified Nitratiruptor]BCD63192.1 hypothetical protein NitYY0813_P33 [Nitratiruptor sp. YY08-13]BCD67128.1 hypothetical protein NitYY0826_P33 [Nitratiruptor sp. YY08-26]
MLKYFFTLVAIIQIAGYAGSFVSLYDGRFLATILGNKDFLNNNNVLTISKDYILVQHANKTKDGEYYHPNGWLRLKYYIPAGTSVDFVIATLPNTSMRIDLKYRGDNNPTLDHINYLPASVVLSAKDDLLYSNEQPTIKHLAINTFSQAAYDMDEGGWVYVTIVENNAEAHGDHGYVETATVRVDCTMEIIDKDKFKKWLYGTTFLSPGGDPVDAIEQLEEYDHILENNNLKDIKRVIKLNPDGNYTLDKDTDVFTTSIHFSVQPTVSIDSQENDNENYEIIDFSSTNQPKTATIANSITSMIPENNLSKEQKETIVTLKSKSFPVSGYFVQVKDEWIYVSNKTKNIYKLKGMEEDNRTLKWIEIPNLTPIITSSSIRFVSSDNSDNIVQENQSSEYSNIDSSSSIKSCPSGYSYDPDLGYCTSNRGNEGASYSSTSSVQQNSNNILPTSNITTNITIQSSSSSIKSCPSGYSYDPDLGYCTSNG